MLSPLLLAAAPVTIASTAQYVDFSYKWSAEAAAVPALDRRFRAEAADQMKRHRQLVTEERRMRREMKSPMLDVRFAFDRTWTTSGQSPRLLSLSSQTYTFTGGAHGNHFTKTLLWDRRLGREVTIDSLLARRGWWDGAIRQPFCTLLDRERAKRRQEPVDRSAMFGECPALKDVSLSLADTNRNGRFDHVLVTADPYVAGSYAEGEYEISLPLTATMLARLKPAYRASFEPQPPVQ
jgi:hypothetical protein